MSRDCNFASTKTFIAGASTMKLTFRLLLLCVLAIAVVTAVYGYVAVRREEQVFAERARLEIERFARLLMSMLDEGESNSLQELDDLLTKLRTEEKQVRYRLVRADAEPDTPFAPTKQVDWTSLSTSKLTIVTGVGQDGAPHLYAYLPLPSGYAALELDRSMNELAAARHSAIAKTLGLLIWLLLATSSVVLGFGYLLMAPPLRKLIRKTRRIADGDLENPVDLARNDELGELATSINEMCDRLRDSRQAVEHESAQRIAAVEQLRHADRLRTVGRLASGIAHELGTPLNVVSGRAAMIASGELNPEQVRESGLAIRKEADRMTAIISQVLDFARQREPQIESVDLRRVIEQTVQLLQPLAAKQHVELRFERPAEEQLAEVDMSRIQQVLTNIIINGVQAIEDGGEVSIRLEQDERTPPEQSDHDPKPVYRIVICDTGPGIEDDLREQVFEPFFTTKEVGEGTGLGLSIAYRITQEHGGWIEVDDVNRGEVSPGCCFAVYLPRNSTRS